MKKYSRMFHACAILHNICIKMGDRVSKQDIAAAMELEAAHKVKTRMAAAAHAPLGGAAAHGVAGLQAGRTLQARLFYEHQRLCLPAPWSYTLA